MFLEAKMKIIHKLLIVSDETRGSHVSIYALSVNRVYPVRQPSVMHRSTWHASNIRVTVCNGIPYSRVSFPMIRWALALLAWWWSSIRFFTVWSVPMFVQSFPAKKVAKSHSGIRVCHRPGSVASAKEVEREREMSDSTWNETMKPIHLLFEWNVGETSPSIHPEHLSFIVVELDPNNEPEPADLPVGISFENLSKQFGENKKAVENLSFKLYENQITALLGHNGAGKVRTLSLARQVSFLLFDRRRRSMYWPVSIHRRTAPPVSMDKISPLNMNRSERMSVSVLKKIFSSISWPSESICNSTDAWKETWPRRNWIEISTSTW